MKLLMILAFALSACGGMTTFDPPPESGVSVSPNDTLECPHGLSILLREPYRACGGPCVMGESYCCIVQDYELGAGIDTVEGCIMAKALGFETVDQKP